MIPGQFLSWALVAASLFNTILLLWLGLTLWLSADRRVPGVVITSVGFFLGSAAFISHSALLLSDTLQLTRSNTLWLVVGLAPVVLLPYVWYVVLLWYSGYWTTEESNLKRRHRPWLWLLGVLLGGGLAGLALLGLPFLPFGDLAPWIWSGREFIKTSASGIPLVAIGYPTYVLLCVILSVEALMRPGKTLRVLGEAARQRARPWLLSATVLLLAVAVLVAVVVLWTITHTRSRGYYILTAERLQVIGRFDLAISLLLAVVIVLLGQAMTAYELFTGRVLPRRGLARHWQRAILLAASYGILMGGALVWGLEPVYGVLLTTVMMTAFFALLGWRSYVEWEQAIEQLRPLVSSEHWYDALVTTQNARQHPLDPFRALCENLLNSTVAFLIPFGPTAAFVTPQAYPPLPRSQMPLPSSLSPLSTENEAIIVPVEPGQHGGATWAVPLWRERGLIGVLFLGPRRDQSLYTQEEIEIARSTGERLIDAAASLSLSQRLMQLQRERMATTQILDQRTRRVLHDEVLPLIHTALLSLSAGQPADAVLHQLTDAHGQVSELLRELPPTVAPEIARLGLVGALQRAVDVEFASAFADVTWQCEGDVKRQAARLNPLATETVYYAAREAVRNAARHARPSDSTSDLCLRITAGVVEGDLQIAVEDNGSGFVQQPGAGQGLDLHSTLMAIVGGSLSLETVPGRRTRVLLSLPAPDA